MTTKALRKLVLATEEMRKLDPQMQAQTIVTFLRVCLFPGCSMADICKATGTSQSSASRNVAALSDWHSRKRAGFGLVEAKADPYEMRRKLVFLTPKGERVKATLEALMEK